MQAVDDFVRRGRAEKLARVNTSIEACALLDRDGKIRRGKKNARVNRPLLLDRPADF